MPDVVVIGAGIIGCTVAEILARRGADVDVFDGRAVGLGATQASGGMLTPHTEGVHDPALETLGVRSLALYDDLIARLSETNDAPPFYSRAGSLHVALDEAEAAGLEALAASHRAHGVTSTLLAGADARQLEREVATDCVAALVIPGHGFVAAQALTVALARAGERRGVRFTTASVQRIARAAGGGVEVTTSTGTLTAPSVVLAAGTWSGQIAIEGIDPLPVKPIRGQLLHLHWPAPSVTRIVWGARCYTIPWPDGTMLVGATSEDVGFDDRATVSGVRDLLDAVAELMPHTWQATFAGVRVGLRPASPDALPIIGRSSRVPGLVYATGHYRNGVLLAPLTGELVASAIAGTADPAFDVTAPSRFGNL